MRVLPRSFEFRKDDSPESVGTRLAIWTRDVIQSFKAIPEVVYLTVPWAGTSLPVAVRGGAPRSVVVARVESGTVSAAPGVEWEPIAAGFQLTAVYGVSSPATLSLRVEV